MLKLINKLSKNSVNIIVFIVIILFTINIYMSVKVSLRYKERRNGLDANTKFEIWIDKYYPDEVLEQVYTKHRIRK